ncbi:hypothetical protein G4B88_000957 [Cannabis sativa]|uniref:Zinc knuckle CX2CX4HX4C domain-containing protein n=1 Tax=Cannabis sativa TaxID=3483 RepID=A0A7J6EZE7_CANSA|nr:hypothetical protein G4B88_000957 [Cannabis sativa]
MESIIATNSPLKGKCFSCLETSVNLSLCASSLKALSSCCLMEKWFLLWLWMSQLSWILWPRLGRNRFLFVAMVDDSKTSNVFRLGFDSAEDRNWALDNGPWCIRGYTLVLQAWTPTIDGSVVFNLLRVWIQLHNLPHEYFSISNGSLLGGLVGKVVKIGLEEDKPALWNQFMKVQVDIDFNKPLVVGCFFDLASGVKKWIQVKFEKIGIFCYYCGCLGHQRWGCKLTSSVTVANNDGILFPMYGPRLSISSTYLDIFSGPKSFGPRSVLSAASGKIGGDLPLLPATIAGGVEDPKSKSFNIRRPRRSLMATSRGTTNLGKSQLVMWIPKTRPLCSVRAGASSGMEGDGGLIDLNNVTIGGKGVCTGPISVGQSLVNNGHADVVSEAVGGIELGSGSVSLGSCMSRNGLVAHSDTSPLFGASQPDCIIKASGPELLDSNGLSSYAGGSGSPRILRVNSLAYGPIPSGRERDMQSGKPISLVPSNNPEGICEAKM